jgi:heme-degrading monooxygenase HmoA
MAVLAMADIPGATHEMYEQVNELMGITPDNPPAGLIQHVGLDTDDGMMMVDVWESAEAFKGFIEGNLDKMQAAGIPPFEPVILPVHNMLFGSGTQPNVALVIDVDGFTPEMYDGLTATMPAHQGDGSNHESVSHTAALKGDSLLIVDIWDSPEHFQRFAQEQLADAGLPPFEPRVLPVYSRLAGKTRVSA